jgi:ATP-binding cassette subfamily F protein 3
LVTLNNIGKEFGGEELFSGASFSINPKDRIGLAGKNGSGKTTLLRIIKGEIQPSLGEVVVPEGHTMGYLPQEMIITTQKTVIEETLDAFKHIEIKKKRLEHIQSEMVNRTDYDSRAYHKLFDEQALLIEQLRLAEPEKLTGNTERILKGLGFKRKDFERPLNEFSFGWQMRVELAKLLLLRPTVLLLDEPTNHLDIESIAWLESFLKNYYGSVVLVSHDRTLLDNITNRTIEINNGKFYDYKVSYSKYIQLREERQSQLRSSADNQQRQIREIERFIERFRYKATKARQVQSRVKMLEKIDRIEVDDLDKKAIHFTFPEAVKSGKVPVTGIKVTKKYGKHTVFSDIDFQVLRGERIAFIGRNGEGKTTLARIIAENLQHTGEVRLGHNVQMAYFSQDQWEMLDPEMTVFETVDHVAVGDIRKRMKSILGAFLFQGDDIDKKVSVLSGGEKSRLSLAKLLLTPSNLLIMDEPTNHLDILSKDILKNALLQYQGTLIIVSHDRDFLQGLTTRLYEFRDQRIKEFRGDLFEFLEKRRFDDLDELERRDSHRPSNTVNNTDKKQQWEQKKETERKIRKVTRSIEQKEAQIQGIESELKDLNEKLSQPEAHQDSIRSGEIYRKHDELNKSLEQAMMDWETLNESLDELNSDEQQS